MTLFFSPLPLSPNINVSLGDEPKTSPPSLAPLKIPQNRRVCGRPSVGSPQLNWWRWVGVPLCPPSQLDVVAAACDGHTGGKIGGTKFCEFGGSMLQGHASSSPPRPAAWDPSSAAQSRAGKHKPHPTDNGQVPIPLPGDISQTPGWRADGERPRWASSSKRLRRCREVKVELGCWHWD